MMNEFLKKWKKKLKNKLCRHKTIMIHGEAEEGDLKEPDQPSRKVRIAMVRTYCKDCDRTFKMNPMGVVFDSVKGIDEPFPTKTVEAPPDVRAEVLRDCR